MAADLAALIRTLPPHRRRHLALLAGLMVGGAFAEIISLGALVPFLAMLADPDTAVENPVIAAAARVLRLDADDDLRWRLTLLFAAAAVGAGLMRIALAYATARFNFSIGHELGAEVFRRTLHQPYERHVLHNSSEVLGGLNKVDVVVWLIFSLLNAACAALMAICVVGTLLLINAPVAIAALLGFGAVYSVVTAFTRKRLALNSDIINSSYAARVQAAQEGLGGIRDVILDRSQDVFARRFVEADLPLRIAQASNNFISPSPRFVIEALGMVLIAVLAYYLVAGPGGVATAVPVLGALALGAQRLMPMLQQVYQGWANVAGNRHLLGDVVDLLREPAGVAAHPESASMEFTSRIDLHRVSFRYAPDLPLVLDGVSMQLRKGERVGLSGPTGCGKSTLVDLVMGLLEPTQGEIHIDGIRLDASSRHAWQQNVAHVPQAIFLLDAAIVDNIAFGVPRERVDMDRVRAAARQAQISDFIDATPMGYDTEVGERGVRLSGGQRQRIGIARALYKQAKVLVFDEATSALDDGTEAAVMRSINGLDRDLTIVLIAHRISTLKACDVIYRLNQGHLEIHADHRKIYSP